MLEALAKALTTRNTSSDILTNVTVSANVDRWATFTQNLGDLLPVAGGSIQAVSKAFSISVTPPANQPAGIHIDTLTISAGAVPTATLELETYLTGILLSPTSGTAGEAQTLTIRGAGYKRGAAVWITSSPELFKRGIRFSADKNGEWSQTVSVTSTLAAQYTITAIQPPTKTIPITSTASTTFILTDLGSGLLSSTIDNADTGKRNRHAPWHLQTEA